jgi:hypothetical protein
MKLHMHRVMYLVWIMIQIPLQRDHDSPCTKDSRSSLVAIGSPINSVLAGRKSPARSIGGTQNRSSESGPKIQPSFMAELSVKGADILLDVLMMNIISRVISLQSTEYPHLRFIGTVYTNGRVFRPRNDEVTIWRERDGHDATTVAF